jgi:prevent-host-death family protein
MSGDDAAQFNIHEAKTNLAKIVERAERGEEIIITRAGIPVAKVVPLRREVALRRRTADRRGRGSLRGRLVVVADWDSDKVNEATARDLGTTP